MEVPLVMRALNARQTAFNELVSRVLTFDYLGALAVSLLFPLVLAPYLGLVRTGFLFGMLNVGVALWTIQVFRTELKNLTGRLLRACAVMLLLVFGFALPTADLGRAWPVRRRDRVCHHHALPAPGDHPLEGRYCACTSTATCSSPRATSTATTKRWCIRCCSAAVGAPRAGAGRRRRPGAARNPALSEYRARHAGGPRPGHDGALPRARNWPS
jgi:hypothetical protein